MSSEIVPTSSYLIVRNGVFYFDMRVPVDVLGAYQRKFRVKSEAIRKSLKTRDRRQARRLAAMRLGYYEEVFAELRRTGDAELVLANKIARHDLSKLSRAELERLVTGYFREVLRPAAVNPPIDSEDRADLVEEWSDTLARVTRTVDEENIELVRNTADHILFKAGWPSNRTNVGTITRHLPSVDVDRTAEQYGALIELVRRASEEGSRLALSKLKGEWFTPSDPLFATEFNLAEANDKLGPLLSEAFAAWREGSGVEGVHKPQAQTVIEVEMVVRHFTQLNGDMRIGEISKKMAKDFAAAISMIPVKLTADLQKLALPELLKRDLSKFKRRSASTVNKSLQLLSAMIEKARKRSALDEALDWPNHFKTERIEGVKTAEDDRVPFGSSDLRSIFVDGPVHGHGERLKGGRGEAQYWLPLLGLFTGARLSELGQLRACHIETDEGGISFMSIGTSGGRKVKTKNSIRKVPIHPELRLMGFLAYVDERRTVDGAEASLWPLLGSAAGRAMTAAWSQWWGNYQGRKPIGITDTRKVFHSFRHLFKDMCRDAGISEDVHDALTGHAPGKSVGRSYGSGHSVARLDAEISKVKVPVDLSHLHAIRVRNTPLGWKARVDARR